MQKEVLQQEVRDLIKNLLQQKQESQNKLAEMMDVSPATISNILNEYWERVNESMLLKVKGFFKPKDWMIIDTTNFATIQEHCRRTRERKALTSIIGYSGAGKTTALQYYYENNANTYMVTCARTMRTKQFLSEILKCLGVNYLASDFEMVRMIIDELNKKESPLLIIDEASKLSPNALMYLQDIWDGIESNGAVVIAGVEYLLLNLKKGADRNKIGMPEFYGRVALWQHLAKPSKKEIEAICEHNGLTDKQAVKDLTGLSNFRMVRNGILNFRTGSIKKTVI